MSKMTIATVTIGSKEYELKANLAFSRYLDKLYATPESEGVSAGIVTFLVRLTELPSADLLIDGIKAGTANEQQKPSNDDIETFIENLDGEPDEENSVESLLNAVLEGVKKSHITRGQYVKAMEKLEVAKEYQAKQMENM